MLFLIFRKDKMPLAETFDKNPLLAVVCVLLCVGYVVMRFFEKSLRQKSYNDADLDERVENAKKELSAAYESIGVPVKAGTADMLIFDYTVEDGRIVPKKNKHSAAPYMICEVRLYQKDGKLFLFDSESVFAFESNEVKEILTVDETVSIEFWGRRGEIDKVKKYKVNGIEADKEGIVSIDRYHILRVEREGREYGLYFPSYELPALERWLASEA